MWKAGSRSALGTALAVTLGCVPMLSSASVGDDWQYSLSPLFLWAQSISGESILNGERSPLELDFKDDVLENLEGAVTFNFEARRGDTAFFVQYMFSDLEPEAKAIGDRINATVDVDFEEQIAEFGAAWTVNQSDATRLEFIGGARYIDQELKTEVGVEFPNETQVRQVRDGDDWWHGFAGMRIAHRMGDRWTLTSRADLGYGGTDNSAFNAALLFSYQFNNWGSAFIGARYLNLDYEGSNGFGFDGSKAGPAAGVTFNW